MEDEKKLSSQSAESSSVYTIPEKFLPGGKGTRTMKIPKPEALRGKRKGWIIWLVLAVVFLGILGAAAYFVFQYQNVPSIIVSDNTNQVNQNQSVLNKNSALVNINAPLLNNNASISTNTNINADSNINAPDANVNANANINTNINANINSDANANTNVNNNINVNAKITGTRDEDGDGLTDTEEVLYGTKANQPDTDEDGYIDGVEIQNLYTPLAGPGKLLELETNIVGKYMNESFPYSVLYHVFWEVQSLDAGNAEVIFTSQETGEFIEVLVQDNPSGLSAQSWYLQQFPEMEESKMETIQTHSGLSGVKSSEGYTAYFSDDTHIYSIAYNYGLKNKVNFLTTWEMVLASFDLKKKKK